MKKALMITSVPSMIGQFNMDNIRILQNIGYEVHVACNFYDTSVWSAQRKKQFKVELENKKICYHQINFPRNPSNLKNIFLSCRQLNRLIQNETFDLVHCHTPTAGVVSRFVAHEQKIRVIYTAHGFHFYKGAPLKNWLLYYPIEWFCSWWTDILVTINREDYTCAKKRFHANHTEYIPGIGIDLTKFSTLKEINREEYRKSLGIPINAFVMVSVGELNKNKNHSVILKAMSLLQEKDVHYVIAGQGTMHDCLLEMAKAFHIENRVHLLGFRNDVSQLYQMADVCVFPSIREGLGIAAIEGMASGLPLICSNNRGARDYAQNGVNAFVCEYNDVDGFAGAIQRLYNAPELCAEFGKVNLKEARRFDIGRVSRIMYSLYSRVE